jgi:hypothetical protein
MASMPAATLRVLLLGRLVPLMIVIIREFSRATGESLTEKTNRAN